MHMSEKHKQPRDSAAATFMSFVRHEARMDSQETPRQHAERLLSEAYENIDMGVQSRDEAIALLAKLDIVSEASNDLVIKTAARVLQSDIRSRYPGIPDQRS